MHARASDTNFVFECSTRYISRVSAANILKTTFCTIFRRFPNTLRRFPKIIQKMLEGQTDFPEHFPKITGDIQGSSDGVSITQQHIEVQFKLLRYHGDGDLRER